MMNFLIFKKNYFEIIARKIYEFWSIYNIKKNHKLWSDINLYNKKTSSTGCSYTDYWELYKLIKKLKPIEVLECGPGVTTVVIANALKENYAENGVQGKITCMENHKIWYEMAYDILPDEFKDITSFVLSDIEEKTFSMFRGVCYKDLPEKKYDFILIDGPEYISPKDKTPCFDFDFLNAIQFAKNNVNGLIDKRVSTCYVLQQLFGHKKIKYNNIKGLGYINNCSYEDIKHHTVSISSESFDLSKKHLSIKN